jgi:outer membrane receptor protein involved in Fe transport
MTAAFLALFLAAAAVPVHVTGRIADATGAPVAAAIHAGAADGPVLARSDALGSFAVDLDPVPAEGVVVVAAGFATERLAADALGRGGPLAIVLRPAPLTEHVTVTAGRRALRGADTPAATTVVTAADLLSAAATTIDDALRFTPGFTLFRRSSSRAANPTTQGVTLRGLSASGASRTLVLADGVPLNDAFGGWVYWSRVPQAAIERIEIVRGATSDLYGADAAGGVIQIVPAGVQQTRGRLSVEGGSLGTSRVSGFGSAHLPMLAHGRGGLGIGVAAERFATDGAPIIAEAERGVVDTPAGVRASSWLVNAALDQDAFGVGLSFRFQGFDEDRANGTPLQTNDTNQHQASLRATGVAGGGAWQAAGFATQQTYDQGFSAVAAGRASESLTQLQRVPSEAVGGSADWLRAWGRATLVAGGEGRRVEGTTNEIRFVAGRPQTPTQAGGVQTTAAGFAQVTVQAAPRWTVVGGTRVDRIATENVTSGRRESDVHPSARGSVTWQASPLWSLRGTAYRAFRSPTLNERFRNFRAGDTLTQANEALVAERLTGGEVSALLAQGPWSARATYFHTSLGDAIANVTLSVTPALTTRQRQNAARVRSQGLELEADWRPTPQWSIGGQLTATSAGFTGGAAGLDGLDVPQVARYQGAVSVRFTDPRWATATVQARVVGRQFEDDRNTLVLDDATVVDLFASRAVASRLHVFVGVENLFDAEVQVGRTPILSIGLPRTAHAGVRVFWR